MAIATAGKLLLLHSPLALAWRPPPNFSHLRRVLSAPNFSTCAVVGNRTSPPTPCSSSPSRDCNTKTTKVKNDSKAAAVKRRTRSGKEFDEEALLRYGICASHIPVMLGEVLEVFASIPLRAFVDCTVGAAGHSSAIIQAHPEMQLYVGLDVDPFALDKAQAQISKIVHDDAVGSASVLKVHMISRNYKDINDVLHEIDEKVVSPGVDGILMDLGISSMQINDAERGFSVLCDGPLDMRMNPQGSLTAEDILNSWPDFEVGRILREYGEESNWYSLQNMILKARLKGGLHSTAEVVKLIQNFTSRMKGGRQGWIKTATRLFQALRIAVNDELNTLRDSLHVCFNCLAPGGRLAVISFHSLEDRIVKQAFLDIINNGKGEDEGESRRNSRDTSDGTDDKEAWIKREIQGMSGRILTKRPITPSQEEEKLNRRCRSAKLRVIHKL